MYKVIDSRVSWDSRTVMTPYQKAISEIFFWIKNLKIYNCRYIKEYNVPRVLVVSDASDTGLAAHTTNNNKLMISFKQFSYDESLKSSTWRELEAINFSLEAFKNIHKK